MSVIRLIVAVSAGNYKILKLMCDRLVVGLETIAHVSVRIEGSWIVLDGSNQTSTYHDYVPSVGYQGDFIVLHSVLLVRSLP